VENSDSEAASCAGGRVANAPTAVGPKLGAVWWSACDAIVRMNDGGGFSGLNHWPSAGPKQ